MPVAEPQPKRRKKRWILILLLVLFGIFLFFLFEAGGFGQLWKNLKNIWQLAPPVLSETPGTLTGGEPAAIPTPTTTPTPPPPRPVVTIATPRPLARVIAPRPVAAAAPIVTPPEVVVVETSSPVPVVVAAPPPVFTPTPGSFRGTAVDPPVTVIVESPVITETVEETVVAPTTTLLTETASTTPKVVSDTATTTVDNATSTAELPVDTSTTTIATTTIEEVPVVVEMSTSTAAGTTTIETVPEDTTPSTTPEVVSELITPRTPGVPSVSVLSTSALTVLIDAGGNLENTLYAVYNTTTGNYVTRSGQAAAERVFFTLSDWGAVVTDLASDTAYQFSVTAKSSGGIVSSASDLSAPVKTLPVVVEPPPVLVIDNDPPPVPFVGLTLTGTIEAPTMAIAVSGNDALSPTTTYDLSFASVSTTQLSGLVTSTLVFTDFATNTLQHEFVVPVIRGRTYFVRARAIDGVGNRSALSAESILGVSYTQEVVINEIAWAGTSSQNTTDEWLELYNNTSASINLSQSATTSWKIVVNGQPLSFNIKNNTIILPNSYFLLKQNTASTILPITPDIFYSSSNGLVNTGAKLQLLNPAGQIIDEVDASAAWFGKGGGAAYRSMERLSSLGSGSDPTNWQDNQGQRLSSGVSIYGSPKQNNIGFVRLSGNQIETNRVLTKINNPYILTGNTIPVGKTLTIGAGVVIKSALSGANFQVTGGKIVANGTAEDPIVFTSGRDQAAAINDGSLLNTRSNTIVGTAGAGVNGTSWFTATPQATDWQGMWVQAGANVTIHSADYRYAGASFTQNNEVFTPSVSQAILVDSATLTIADSNFVANGSKMHILVANSAATINNTSFSGGDLAIDSDTSALSLSNVTVSNFTNSKGPFWIKKTQPTLTQLILNNNTKNLVFLDRVDIKQAMTWTKDVPWLISSAKVFAGTTLTIDPGTVVTLPAQAVMTVNGNLNAVGNVTDRITFKSSSSTDFWGNIIFNNSTSVIKFADLSRGNQLQSEAIIIATNSNLTLDESTVIDPRAPGNVINLTNSTLTAKNTTIGYTIKPTTGNAIGINATKGIIALDNVVLKNLGTGLNAVGTPRPVLTATKMTLSTSFPGITTGTRIVPSSGWFTFPP